MNVYFGFRVKPGYVAKVSGVKINVPFWSHYWTFGSNFCESAQKAKLGIINTAIPPHNNLNTDQEMEVTVSSDRFTEQRLFRIRVFEVLLSIAASSFAG